MKGGGWRQDNMFNKLKLPPIIINKLGSFSQFSNRCQINTNITIVSLLDAIIKIFDLIIGTLTARHISAIIARNIITYFAIKTR